jgi:type IV secretory pathway VirB10-like protein
VQQAVETKAGSLDAHDIEKTKNPVTGGVGVDSGKKATSGSNAKSLGDLGQFQQPNTDPDHLKNWTPEPYSGSTQSAGGQQRQDGDEYAKPSMVFVAHLANSASAGNSQIRSTVSNFGLQSGYHVAARLESMASTALQAPVTAVIEYNYERDGRVLIPAGSRAVGKISQADASGIMNIAFDSIELPGGENVLISAIGATTSLQALKGQVTGKNTGRSFAVRALAGLGQAGAMLVGQSNVNGSLSESDLIRQRAAENIGSGADSQVMSMMLTQHIVVSVPAGTEIYIIFTKPQKAIQATQTNQTATSSIPPPATTSNQ